MAHAIIRGANGRRYEVDFENVEITVEVFFGDETVETAVEAPEDPATSDKQRFALLKVPRELFNKALGEAARRPKTERPAILEGKAAGGDAAARTRTQEPRRPCRARHLPQRGQRLLRPAGEGAHSARPDYSVGAG